MKAAAKTRTPKPARRKPAVGALAIEGHAPAFREIIGLIQSAQQRLGGQHGVDRALLARGR